MELNLLPKGRIITETRGPRMLMDLHMINCGVDHLVFHDGDMQEDYQKLFLHLQMIYDGVIRGDLRNIVDVSTLQLLAHFGQLHLLLVHLAQQYSQFCNGIKIIWFKIKNIIFDYFGNRSLINFPLMY